MAASEVRDSRSPAWQVAAVATVFALVGWLAGGIVAVLAGLEWWPCILVGTGAAAVFGASLEWK